MGLLGGNFPRGTKSDFWIQIELKRADWLESSSIPGELERALLAFQPLWQQESELPLALVPPLHVIRRRPGQPELLHVQRLRARRRGLERKLGRVRARDLDEASSEI